MKSSNTLAKNIIWQYGLQVLKYVFPLILVPYLTRVLGTGGYAVYAYVLSFMGIVQTLADFGFMLSGTKQVVDLRDNCEVLSRLLGSIELARLLLAAGLCAVVVVVAQFIPLLWDNMGYVLIAYVSTVLRALLPDFMFQGFEDMEPLTTRFFAAKVITVGLTLLVVHGPQDLLLVAVADTLGGLVALIWSFMTVRTRYGVRVSFGGFRNALAELKRSAVYCVSNIGTTLVSGFTTFVVGIVLTDPTEIAYWSLALTTVSAVQALYSPISSSLYPHVVAHRDLGAVRKMAIMAAPALLVGTVAYCLLSPHVFFLLGGQGYVAGSWVMVALSPVLPLSFYSILIGWPVLGALGKVNELTASTVASGVINAALLLAMALLGRSSLLAICVIRCIAEVALLGTRGFALIECLRKGKLHV